MTAYERSTTATTAGRLPEPLLAAVRERAERAVIDVPPDTPAFLTRNVRTKRPGLFGRLTKTADADAEHHVALVLTPGDVLVGIHGERRGTSVLYARLTDCEVSDLGRLQAAAGVDAGDGVSLSGFPGYGEGGPASFWIGLGPPDGDAARAALTAAIGAAKK